MKLILQASIFGFLLLGLLGCNDFGYYVQCAQGHLDLMSRTRPIEEVLKDSQVSEAERSQLLKALEIRAFASAELGLPENNSYRRYANIGRPYVVWNVVAAPEFSLDAKEWCFPVAGCVKYRGYFNRDSAEDHAAELIAEGFDVDVYGVKAYSTLNWFDDPVLNTFLDGLDYQLAALIFHELAHQQLYVPGDSSFNEAFAKTVELEGLKRWLQSRSSAPQWQSCLERDTQSRQFQKFLGEVRERLQNLYVTDLPENEKRRQKQLVLTAAQEDYQAMRKTREFPSGYDHWMAEGLNNARLTSVATYYELVPAFQALLEHQQGNLVEFYREAKMIGELPANERLAKLRNLGRGILQAQLAKETMRTHGNGNQQ